MSLLKSQTLEVAIEKRLEEHEETKGFVLGSHLGKGALCNWT